MCAATRTKRLTFLFSLSHVVRPLLSTYCNPKNQISRRPIVLTTWKLKRNFYSISPFMLFYISLNGPDANTQFYAFSSRKTKQNTRYFILNVEKRQVVIRMVRLV